MREKLVYKFRMKFSLFGQPSLTIKWKVFVRSWEIFLLNQVPTKLIEDEDAFYSRGSKSGEFWCEAQNVRYEDSQARKVITVLYFFIHRTWEINHSRKYEFNLRRAHNTTGLSSAKFRSVLAFPKIWTLTIFTPISPTKENLTAAKINWYFYCCFLVCFVYIINRLVYERYSFLLFSKWRKIVAAVMRQRQLGKWDPK